jgi:hypothetical protein
MASTGDLTVDTIKDLPKDDRCGHFPEQAEMVEEQDRSCYHQRDNRDGIRMDVPITALPDASGQRRPDKPSIKIRNLQEATAGP